MNMKLFRNRNFRFLTLVDTVSVLGDQIGWVALLWFVTVTGNSAVTVGLIGLVYGIPGIFLGPIVGTILDAVPPKRVLLASNILLGAVFATIPGLYAIHRLSLTALLLMVLLAGCLTPFITTGWMVILPTVVGDEELGSANSVVEVVWHGASLIGPLAGGFLIAAFGSPTAVLVDGVSFWLAAISVGFLKLDSGAKSVPSSTLSFGGNNRFWQETWEGFRLLYRLKPVWWITLGALVLNLAFGQLEVSLPLLTHLQLRGSSVVLGSFWTAFFGASLIGSGLSSFLFKGGRPGLWMPLMAIGWGVSFLPMIWNHTPWMTYLSMACAGLLFAGYPPLARTTVQRLVAPNFQGRIMALRGSLMAAGIPIGSYLGGQLGARFLPSTVMGSAGILVMVTGLWLLLRRDFRLM